LILSERSSARSRLSSITGSGSSLLDADVLDLLLCVSHTLSQNCPAGRIRTIFEGFNKRSNVLVDILTLSVVIGRRATRRAAAARLPLRLLRLNCLEKSHSITGLHRDTPGKMAL
jgi:hypothetical protein